MPPFPALLTSRSRSILVAAIEALKITFPILVGFAFCGFSYGLYMHTLGFDPIYPVLMAVTIFAGSLEFIIASMLTGPFAPLTAFMTGLIVNGRHLFYGIAMLDRYRDTGAMKGYLIFGLCDETFSILNIGQIPKGADKNWYYFFVSFFNQMYWVTATAVGAFMGQNMPFDTRGIEFVLPALFLAIFVSSWQKEESHFSSVGGLLITLSCLFIIGSTYFLLASMAVIIAVLMIFRKHLDPLWRKN